MATTLTGLVATGGDLLKKLILHPARGKAIVFVLLSVCLSASTKIARSGDLDVIAKYKYHYNVEKVGKLTFFSLLDA